MLADAAYRRLTAGAEARRRPAAAPAGGGSIEDRGREVVASPGYLDLPRGREAGESPAQSRYGDHPSDGGWKSGRRARGRCSTFERKGRQRCERPADNPSFVRSEGFRRVPAPRSVPRSLEPDVPAFRPTHPAAHASPPAASPPLAVLAILVVAACSSAATPSPVHRRPTPTGSLVPAGHRDAAPVAPSPSPAPAVPADPHRRRGHHGRAPAEPTEDRVADPGRDRDPVRARRRRPDRRQGRGLHPLPARGRRRPRRRASSARSTSRRSSSLGADLVIAGGNGFNPPDTIAKLRALEGPGPRRLRARTSTACSTTSS